MPTYTVEQGDHLSRIAAAFGFGDYRTIWNHPKNADLRKKRGNPHVLFPGDQVFVPDKQQKALGAPTAQQHVFKVSQQPLRLHLAIVDEDDQPVANTECDLDIDGEKAHLTTDGKGRLTKPIPRTAKEGKLKIIGLDVPIFIGHLDPVDQVTGQQARLNNLGYFAGEVGKSDPDAFQSAVEEFQCDHHLKVDGKCGPMTQTKLKEVHGC